MLGDGDIASFFYYMGIALKKAAPRYKKPLPVLTPEYLGDIPTFTRNFFRELFSRLKREGGKGGKGEAGNLKSPHRRFTHSPFLVVLDNYQDVPEDSNLHDVLHTAMSEVPEGVNLLVLSRVEPPSVLARLRLCEHAACLDWEKMRLTPEETIGISMVRFGDHGLDPDILNQLHDRVHGWAAGVVLMLEQSRGGAPLVAEPATTNQKLLFDYFAGEIFHRCKPKVQEFLLKTALFPKITAKAAEALTGIAESQTILDDLSRRNYFTVRHGGPDGDTYQYHPLFKEFLLKEEEKCYAPEELKALRRRAANLLRGFGYIDEAADLFIKIGNWELLVQLILQHAATQLAHGRWHTIMKWISALPAEHIDSNPWLLFYRASATMPQDLFAARKDFHRAYLEFKKQDDPIGLYLAWSSAVETFMYVWVDFAPLDYWIDEMEALRRLYPEYPSLEIEARVTYGMVGTAIWRRPDVQTMGKWGTAAISLLDKPVDLHIKLMIGYLLLLYYMWWQGNLAKSRMVFSMMREFGEDPHASIISRLLWKVTEAAHLYLIGEVEPAIKAAHEGLDMATESGVHHLDLRPFLRKRGGGAVYALHAGTAQE
jgi:hypothetical protein